MITYASHCYRHYVLHVSSRAQRASRRGPTVMSETKRTRYWRVPDLSVGNLSTRVPVSGRRARVLARAPLTRRRLSHHRRPPDTADRRSALPAACVEGLGPRRGPARFRCCSIQRRAVFWTRVADPDVTLRRRLGAAAGSGEQRRAHDRTDGEDRGRPGEPDCVAVDGGVGEQPRGMGVAREVVRRRARRARRPQRGAERSADLLRCANGRRRDPGVVRLDAERGIADRGGDHEAKADARRDERREDVGAVWGGSSRRSG